MTRAVIFGTAVLLSMIVIRPGAQTPAGTWTAAPSGPHAHELTYTATVLLLGKPTPITVKFFCDFTDTANEHGALGFDLSLASIAALASFGFDDFEGPDAPALKRLPLQATVVRAGRAPLVFNFAPSGWYPSEGRFSFGVAAVSRQAASRPKLLLTALADGAASLRIAITDLHRANLKLDFTIPVVGKQADFKTLIQPASY